MFLNNLFGNSIKEKIDEYIGKGEQQITLSDLNFTLYDGLIKVPIHSATFSFEIKYKIFSITINLPQKDNEYVYHNLSTNHIQLLPIDQ